MNADSEHTLFVRELIEFLSDARRQTAAQEHPEELPDATRQFSWHQPQWTYVDRYTGTNPYGGQTLVWSQGQVVWMMNYYAEFVSDSVAAREIHAFQRKMLSQPDSDNPIRGPSEFTDNQFCYRNSVTGELTEFYGDEQIMCNDIEVHRMRFHGGLILN